MPKPLAYHLTWTTYGTWLPGDPRGWVRSGETGVQAPDPAARSAAAGRMSQPPVVLSDEQRQIVEATIRVHVAIRGWRLHALNVRTNHVHVVVTADLAPEEAMNQFKAWCSRKLSEAAGGKRKWWTEHGSTKWINDEAYFANAVHYVENMQ